VCNDRGGIEERNNIEHVCSNSFVDAKKGSRYNLARSNFPPKLHIHKKQNRSEAKAERILNAPYASKPVSCTFDIPSMKKINRQEGIRYLSKSAPCFRSCRLLNARLNALPHANGSMYKDFSLVLMCRDPLFIRSEHAAS